VEDNINKNNDQSWERKGTLPTVNPKRLRERKRREMIVLPWLGCLASYIGCLLCASLYRLGGDIHPTIIG